MSAKDRSHVLPWAVAATAIVLFILAVGAFDPAKAGAPFVIRIHSEAGYIIMPGTERIS